MPKYIHRLGRFLHRLRPAERAEVRRQILAELVVLAKRHAAGHQELHEAAVEHGREDMATRAYANWNAWMEVARVLEMDPRA